MTYRTALLCASLILVPFSVSAEEFTQWSSPATGSDAVTNLMGKENFFMPHEDDCSASQAFIKVWENQDSVDIGFCIEDDERVAAEWSDARDTCVNANMRLPEPGEFKLACDTGVGLNDMTDAWEWVSNFASSLATDDSTPSVGTAVPTGGNGGCNYGSADFATSITGTIGSLPYRCVR
ncbi:MAG: hypothetical protein RIB43_15065 [Rhodospirillaceae bacterium]